MPASTPQEIHFLFERAFNIGDVEAILALYEPGAVLVASGKPVTGHDGIRDALNVFLSSGARMKLDTRAVIESGEGLAVLHGAWSLGPPSATQGAEHRGSAPPTGRQLDVCHRQSEYAAIDPAFRRLVGFPRVRLETTPQAESPPSRIKSMSLK
jgi:ketosteroid isomerase-like protein